MLLPAFIGQKWNGHQLILGTELFPLCWVGLSLKTLLDRL
jgi:hypothetical protein